MPLWDKSTPKLLSAALLAKKCLKQTTTSSFIFSSLCFFFHVLCHFVFCSIFHLSPFIPLIRICQWTGSYYYIFPAIVFYPNTSYCHITLWKRTVQHRMTWHTTTSNDIYFLHWNGIENYKQAVELVSLRARPNTNRKRGARNDTSLTSDMSLHFF